MAVGYRQKMNLDLTEEEFEQLSLRDMNELNIRLAKRLNQSLSYWKKKNADVAHTIEIRYGKRPFSYAKSKRKEDAIRKQQRMRNYIKRGYSSVKAYKEVVEKQNEQLAKNTGLSFLRDAEKEELGNFFSIMYRKLRIDETLFNYRQVCSMFIDYKLTANESEDMEKFIFDNWIEYNKNNDNFKEKVENISKLSKYRKDGDKRAISEIYRSMIGKK